jgi:hypothetical protein
LHDDNLSLLSDSLQLVPYLIAVAGKSSGWLRESLISQRSFQTCCARIADQEIEQLWNSNLDPSRFRATCMVKLKGLWNNVGVMRLRLEWMFLLAEV